MRFGEDRNVQLPKGVWLCCVRGLDGLRHGGDLQLCNIFHVVLLVVSHEQLECTESLLGVVEGIAQCKLQCRK